METKPQNRFRLAPKESPTPAFPIAGAIPSSQILAPVDGGIPLEPVGESATDFDLTLAVNELRAVKLQTSGYDDPELTVGPCYEPGEEPERPAPPIISEPKPLKFAPAAPAPAKMAPACTAVDPVAAPISAPRMAASTLRTKMVLGPNPNKPKVESKPAPAVTAKAAPPPVPATPAKPAASTPVVTKPAPVPSKPAAPAAAPVKPAPPQPAVTVKPSTPSVTVKPPSTLTQKPVPPAAAAAAASASPVAKVAEPAKPAAPPPAPPKAPAPASAQTAAPEKPVEKPVADKPAPEKAAPEKTAAEKSAPEKPAAEKPAAERPASSEKPKINVRPTQPPPAPPAVKRPALPPSTPARPAMAARDHGNAVPVEQEEVAAPLPSPKPKVQPIRPAATPTHDVPNLGMDASDSFWSKAPIAAKAGIAVVALAAIIGGGMFVFKGGSSTQSTTSTTPTDAPAAVAASAGTIIGGGGWSPNWGSDVPHNKGKQISIFRPTMIMADYVIEFTGQIEKKSIGWIFRAHDPKNYYVYKLKLVKPGSEPVFALEKFAVVDGKEDVHTQVMLNTPASLDTVWKIRTDVQGKKFTTYVQDKLADYMTDDRIKVGGAGFYNDSGEYAQIRSSRFSHIAGE